MILRLKIDSDEMGFRWGYCKKTISKEREEL